MMTSESRCHFSLHARGTNHAETGKTFFDLIYIRFFGNAVRSDGYDSEAFGNNIGHPHGAGDQSAGGCDSGSLMPGLPFGAD